MRLAGRVFRAPENRFWLIEVPVLDLMTQGRSRRDACSMMAGAIEALANRPRFKVEVRLSVLGEVTVGASDEGILIALLLRRQREAHRLTLIEVARRLGSRSPNAYARYEQGKCVPTLKKLDELMRAIDPDIEPILKVARHPWSAGGAVPWGDGPMSGRNPRLASDGRGINLHAAHAREREEVVPHHEEDDAVLGQCGSVSPICYDKRLTWAQLLARPWAIGKKCTLATCWTWPGRRAERIRPVAGRSLSVTRGVPRGLPSRRAPFPAVWLGRELVDGAPGQGYNGRLVWTGFAIEGAPWRTMSSEVVS